MEFGGPEAQRQVGTAVTVTTWRWASLPGSGRGEDLTAPKPDAPAGPAGPTWTGIGPRPRPRTPRSSLPGVQARLFLPPLANLHRVRPTLASASTLWLGPREAQP